MDEKSNVYKTGGKRKMWTPSVQREDGKGGGTIMTPILYE
jgi:hypothetical protein